MPQTRLRLQKGKEKLRRRRAARARRGLSRRLALQVPLFPPRQGSRRPEWASRLTGEWSSLRGQACSE